MATLIENKNRMIAVLDRMVDNIETMGVNVPENITAEEQADKILSISTSGITVNAPTVEVELPFSVGGGEVFYKTFEVEVTGGNFTPNPPASSGLAMSADESTIVSILSSTPYFNIYKKIDGIYTLQAAVANPPTGSLNGCAISADGETLAFTSTTAPNIFTYKLMEGVYVRLPDPDVLLEQYGYSCALSSDGTYLAVGGNRAPFISFYKFDGVSYKKLPNPDSLPTSTANGCQFSSSDTYVTVSGSSNTGIIVYKRDGDAFTRLASVPQVNLGSVQSVVISKDENYLMAAGSGGSYLAILKRVGDTFELLPLPPTPLMYGYSCGISNDNRFFVVSTTSYPNFYALERIGDKFTLFPQMNLGASSYARGFISFSDNKTFCPAVAFNGINLPFLTLDFEYKKVLEEGNAMAVEIARESGNTGDTIEANEISVLA